MNRIVILCSAVLLGIFLNCSDKNDAYPLDFYKGVDISILQKLENFGAVYKQNGQAKDALQIFKDGGINCIRLRLFHTPNDSGPVCNSLPYTLKFARRIKNAGLQLMLDFHYSDTWADPGKQFTPKAWLDLSFDVLKDSLHQYTRQVMNALKRQNTVPELVQIGNEISNGMVWDSGRVSGDFETAEQWRRLGDLLKAGILAVQNSVDPAEMPKIIIHFDEGSNTQKAQWFFDHLLQQGVEFDILCLSYYPMWHGTMEGLQENLSALAAKYEKDIFVVETGYPWAEDPDEPLDKTRYTYPATPQGQNEFLRDMMFIVKNTPSNRGKGLFYWAPEWVKTSGWGAPQWSGIFERMALFDDEGNVLPGLEVFIKQ